MDLFCKIACFLLLVGYVSGQAFSANCSVDSDCWGFSRSAVCQQIRGANLTVATNFTAPSTARPPVVTTAATNSTAANSTAVTTGGAAFVTAQAAAATTARPFNATALIGYCVCDASAGFKRQANTCLYQAKLFEKCQRGKSVCIARNSVCRNDGSNQAVYRCLCGQGFYRVPDVLNNNTYVCGTHITYKDDPKCKICENNKGKCVDRNNDRKKDYCVCPASRSGSDCQTTHVNVTCDSNTFSMTVCYTPHPTFTFGANSSAALYVDGKGTDKACKGIQVGSNDTRCSPGSIKLVLPMRESERGRCGTTNFYSDLTTRRYDNRLVVQKRFGETTSEDLYFKTYCSFKTQADARFKGVGVVGVDGNNQGETKEPKIILRVENHFGELIPEGVALIIGDKIRLKLLLTDDGTYSAVKVLRCTASNSASMPDHSAVTVSLIEKSCPTAANVQRVFTNANTWRLISSRKNQLQTGLFGAFMLSQGNTVFIHCVAQLCLKGSESSCAMTNCTAPQSSRFRRDANKQITTTATKRLIVYEGSRNRNGYLYIETAVFGSLLAVILVLLLIFIVITIFLYNKLRSKVKEPETISTFDKPQRFALPRMHRPVRF